MTKLTCIFSAALAAAFLAVTPVHAAGHGEPEPAAEETDLTTEGEVSYYNISPDFVTNCATLNPRDKVHFIKVRVSLMLGDSNDTSMVTDMDPLIKDTIVSILGSKEFNEVTSNQGREKIRVECRDKLVAIMNDKVGRQVIDDVLFLNYMYQ